MFLTFICKRANHEEKTNPGIVKRVLYFLNFNFYCKLLNFCMYFLIQYMLVDIIFNLKRCCLVEIVLYTERIEIDCNQSMCKSWIFY